MLISILPTSNFEGSTMAELSLKVAESKLFKNLLRKTKLKRKKNNKFIEIQQFMTSHPINHSFGS